MVGGFPTAGRLRELVSKYGKVAVAVHMSVSTISISGFYVAIKNNMDVESALQRFGLLGKDVEEALHREEQVPAHSPNGEEDRPHSDSDHAWGHSASEHDGTSKDSNSQKEKALMSSGSVLVLAVLCNKALLPLRVPLTVALTPPIARFLARRKLYNTGH
ncbi:hypothetical protein GOP47_0018228 [Adiantum capillus-veneris]|uniref:DUF1279 domain-containing protein n=1 Tax=Adiantum capillus-veneris TaxID=13818 RepID=A0A9D4UGY9_ADICA|nr:hypothetical protein GOP47_0018228 [Adiantum capillus-veneris]